MMKFRSLFLALALLLAPCAASAATLISTANGNIDATGTWSLIDTTGTNAFLNSETANTALTTTPVASSTFTPASETITSIGVKIASRAAAPSGTITIKLANSTSAGNRECTQTVNVADLVTAAAATAEGGWAILTCSATPNGTDAYTITASTSIAAQVNLFSLATTNWSRMIVTSGTQASGPAAGDKFYVFGQLTGAGTHNAFTVTIETTANINYGNIANTLVDPSIAVGQFGTLTFATSASTNYKFEHAGPAVSYNGGTFSIGTLATPIPSTSTATYTQNSTVEGDTGWNFRNGATWNSFGSSGGRTVTKTKLNTLATGGVTSTLTVADSTGWLAGDSIVIAGTQTTGGSDATSKWDAATLTSNASGTSLPLTGAVTNTHTATSLSYTSTSTGIAYAMNMFADVILLNRNVIVQGSGATGNGYLYFQNNSIAAIDWTEFSQISGATAGKRGVEVDTGASGSFSLTNSSFINSVHSCLVLAGSNTLFGGTSGSYLTVQHIVMYNCANTASSSQTWYGVGMPTATFNPFWKLDDITIVRTGYASFSANPFNMRSTAGQVTNINISGSGNSATGVFIFNTNYGALGTIGGQVGNAWGPFTLYANVGWVTTFTGGGGLSGTINGIFIWHEQGRFATLPGLGHIVIDPFYIITSGFGIYVPTTAGFNATIRNGVIGWDSNASGQSFPLTADAVNGTISFENMELCPVGSLGGVTFVACTSSNVISLMHDIAASTAAGTPPTQTQVFLNNTSILNNQGVNYPTMRGEEGFFGSGASITQDCGACTPVTHAAWVQGGFLNYDTIITHTSGFSLRMTPKLQTFSGFISGTTLTVTSGSIGTGSPAIGDVLTSNGSGFINGTYMTAGTGTSFTVSQSQTVGSVGTPVQFQSYTTGATNVLLREQSAPLGQGMKVGVNSGQAATVCVWVRPSINTDAAPPWGGSAVTYNADNPRMVNRENPAMGVQSVTVLATFAGSAGAWSQLCGTTPTAPQDGEYEIVIDADQTFTSNPGGWVNVTEWSCTNCNSVSGSRYWWNGVPADVVVPASGGGSGGGVIGGYLLNRDLRHDNDNSPVWLDRAG